MTKEEDYWQVSTAAPWKDETGVWRVGGRSRDTVPFTSDGKPAILLPEQSRYTLLAMKAAHNFAHSRVEATGITILHFGV